MKPGVVILLGLYFASITAHADQCAWNDPAVARKAVKILEEKNDVVLYCELCTGDRPLKKVITEVSAEPVEGGKYQEVYVNREAVDLAYVFVATSKKGVYLNLGRLVDCGASGVSEAITYPQVGKAGDPHDGWYGKYAHTTTDTTLELKKQSLHGPHWLRIRINLISDEWGDNRGELTGYLHMDKKPHRYVTPFHGCHLRFKLDGDELTVNGQPSCGPLNTSVAGKYRRQ